MRGSRAVLPTPLWPPSWGDSCCPNVICPPGGPSWGGSNGPLAGLSPTPCFQGKAWVLSPWPGFHCG